MTKRQRLEATFAGAAIDRPAVALWRHWPVDDRYGPEMARAHVEFQGICDFDFIKVTPSSDFMVAGYGAESHWVGNQEGTREWAGHLIQSPEDWTRLKPLDPHQGLYGEVIEANRLIGQAVRAETPFIQTIFNPLSQAKNLAGERLLSDLRQHPEVVKAGLTTLTESTLRFIEAIKPTGVSGIFLASQHATYDLLTEAEYREFCRPLDLQILAATAGMWFNLLHLHGTNVMFDLLADYPVQVINWHDVETPPSLGEALSRTDKALCGGIRQWETMLRGTPDKVQAEAQVALKAMSGRRFILGTGCVTPITAPTCNIWAARRVVDRG
jgi:uroporphyrinogen decarboxylase